MININEINKTYNKGKSSKFKVIDNTSLELPSKGLVVFTGSSGSGKSTLINCIGGLEKYDSGTITYQDSITSKGTSNKLDKYRAQNIGYVFQHYYLIEHKTVEENVRLSLDIINYKSEEEIKTRVFEALKLVGMENYLKRKAGFLSGGQQQRVAIARALVKDPKVLICDEPTGNLDSKNTYNVMDILKKVSSRKLVLLVTHEQEIANFYADNIIHVKDGVCDNTNINSEVDLNEADETTVFLDEYNKSSFSEDNKSLISYTKNEAVTNIDVVIVEGKVYLKSTDANLIDINHSRINVKENGEKKIANSNVTYQDIDLSPITINSSYSKTSFIQRILKDTKSSFEDFKHKKLYAIITSILLLGLSLAFLLTMQYSVYLREVNPYLTDLYYSDSIGILAEDWDDEFDIELDSSLWINTTDDGGNYTSSSTSGANINVGNIDGLNLSLTRVQASYRNIETVRSSKIIAGEITDNVYDYVISKKLADVILSSSVANILNIQTYKDVLNFQLSFSGLATSAPTAIVDTNDVSIYISQEAYVKMEPSYSYSIYNRLAVFMQHETEWYTTSYDQVLADNEVLLHSSYVDTYAIGDTYTITYSTLGKGTTEYEVVGYYDFNEYSSEYGYFEDVFSEDADSTRFSNALILSEEAALLDHNYRILDYNVSTNTSFKVIAFTGDDLSSYKTYFNSRNITFYQNDDIVGAIFEEEADLFAIIVLALSIFVTVLIFFVFRVQLMSNISEISTLRILGYTKYQILRQYTVRSVIYFLIYSFLPLLVILANYYTVYVDLQDHTNIYTITSVIIPMISLLAIYIVSITFVLAVNLFRKSTIQLINTYDI